MDSKTLREKFLRFFEKNGHTIIPSASLVPSEEEQLAGKEKVLFTSAGMQPLIPYLTGQKEPPGKRLVDVQKCLRTDDIEEVGDEVHHTFFEMLGNWSIGDYWKDEAIELSFNFLTKELNIPIEKLAVTVFAGDEDAPKDEESARKWKSLGIPGERIFYFGKSHNWWPTARGEQASGEYKNPLGPCGPDTEMFYWTGEGTPEGKPNEDSRWVEIWNDVFMQFNRKEDGSLENLPQRNVDTGMGLERTLAVLTGKKSDYETDVFEALYKDLRKSIQVVYNNNAEQRMRIFLDHSRAAIFLIADGVRPSSSQNKRDSVLIRLIRGATDQVTLLFRDITHTQGVVWWQKAFQHFKIVYEVSYDLEPEIFKIIEKELLKYSESISSNEFKVVNLISLDPTSSENVLAQNTSKYLGTTNIDSLFRQNTFTSLPSVAAGSVAFDAKTTLGFPIEGSPGTASIAEVKLGKEFDRNEFEKTIDIFNDAHRKASKGIAVGMFKGGLADHSEIVTKYHTATHLLHQVLRDVLGPEVFQKGSNITAERLRFDFSFDRKLTEEEIKSVENIINKKIEEGLKVDKRIVSSTEAKNSGAIGLFDEKYGAEVSIYGIGPGYSLDPEAKDQRERSGYYSLEFCGGPHVEKISVIGKIKITKEEAVSSGTRRIRAQIVA
jgi:alanyl-tRNA synthetase